MKAPNNSKSSFPRLYSMQDRLKEGKQDFRPLFQKNSTRATYEQVKTVLPTYSFSRKYLVVFTVQTQ